MKQVARILLVASAIILLMSFSPSTSIGYAAANTAHPSRHTDTDGLPWNTRIVATYYGESTDTMWGGYGNRLNPQEDYFCALPASEDTLDCLGGKMACKIGRCGDAESQVDALTDPSGRKSGNVEFWPARRPASADIHDWVIEGHVGDGLFRVIEIKASGSDGPIFEAYVGDVGPWNQDDPYWVDGSRPDAEDGTDSHGRTTNHAGIDISYALAQTLKCDGIMHVDWRWKTLDGKYVVSRRATEWR